MSEEGLRLFKALVELVGLLLTLYLLSPTRPPIAAIAWHNVALGAAWVAEHATRVSLEARTRYWQAIQP